MPKRMVFRPSGRASGPVGPEHPRDFLGPSVFCSIQAFVQAIENGAIADLGLTTALRIVGSGEPTGDLILRAEVVHLLAGKLCPIIGDNGLRESEATHDVLSKKLDTQLTSDFGEASL